MMEKIYLKRMSGILLKQKKNKHGNRSTFRISDRDIYNFIGSVSFPSH